MNSNYWRLVLFLVSPCILASLVGQARGQEPPKPPTIEQAQTKIADLEKQIADLKAKLAEAQARAQLGWGYFNVCIENQIQQKIKP